MPWETIIYTCLTVALLVTIFGIIMTLISAKNMKKNRKLMQFIHESLKVGDKIVFAGGIIGVITFLDEEEMKVRIAENTIIKASRFSIQSVIRKEN